MDGGYLLYSAVSGIIDSFVIKVMKELVANSFVLKSITMGQTGRQDTEQE